MTGRLRVLLVTPDYPPAVGGIQLLLHRLATHLDADVRVITLAVGSPRAGAPTGAALQGATPVHRLRPVMRLGHRAAVAQLNVVSALSGLSWRPDVVVSGHVVTAPAALLMRRLFGVPYVQYVYAAEASRRRGMLRTAITGASAVIVISAHSAELARAAGAPEGAIRLVPPGVDEPPSPRVERDQAPTVVTIARFADLYKGHDVILRAASLVAARVPGVRWVLVGTGPQLAWYRSAATALGAAHTLVFAGALDDAQRDDVLDRAHVFAMPSRDAGTGGEGFGIVYLEAALHGLPVVAGNTGGARDAVVDGVTGVLVDATDHVAVAATISRLLLDRAFADRLGAAGRARAHQFTWVRMAEAVGAVLQQVAGQPRAA